VSGTGNNPRRRRIAGERKRAHVQGPVAPDAGATGTSDEAVRGSRGRAPRAGGATSDVAAGSASAASGSAATPRWLVPLIALTVAATLLAGWMGWQTLQDERGPQSLAAAEPQVLPGSPAVDDATEAATVLFSFSHDRLDEQLEGMRPYLTDDYAEQFFATFPDKVRQRLVQREVRVETTVLAAAAMDCGTACEAEEAQVLPGAAVPRQGGELGRRRRGAGPQ